MPKRNSFTRSKPSKYEHRIVTRYFVSDISGIQKDILEAVEFGHSGTPRSGKRPLPRSPDCVMDMPDVLDEFCKLHLFSAHMHIQCIGLGYKSPKTFTMSLNITTVSNVPYTVVTWII